MRYLGLRRMIVGVGAFLHGLNGAEKRAQADFVALRIRVGQLLSSRCAAGVLPGPAGLSLGQLRPDVEFELVQEFVVVGRGAHLCSRRVLGRMSVAGAETRVP